MRNRLFALILTALLAAGAAAQSSRDPYIGYVYPAGGQRGTTFQVRLGGQRIDQVSGAVISGEDVQIKIVDCFSRLNNNDIRLMKEQLNLLKGEELDEETKIIRDKIQRRISEDERQPASQSLATVVLLEVTIDKDAEPGLREIRLMAKTGLSNPLSFYVGRLPETSRTPMKISKFQTLGKEGLAQRKRPPEEEEVAITLPCTVNGQIASGEINRYRFHADKGDRLVITTLARQLVPYIADAVPGWFQPVLTLRNADGKEMAFNDDYRFKPDPTLLYEVPAGGDYILSIHDSIYRGREDFVYRITLGETPFITSVFPSGRTVGDDDKPDIEGWNLGTAKLQLPALDAEPGIHQVAADRGDALSNYIPFALDTLPECTERANPITGVQKVDLPVIINGRIEKPGDRDVFKFAGRKGQMLVAEVNARRLDSPLDSIIKLTDDDGKLIAFNDDHADPGSGLNTHHADSYLRVKLPEDGTYTVHLTDTARQGGDAYTYRLRLGPPQPDFALRTVPSKLNLRKDSASVEVFVIRRDGFDKPIMLELAPVSQDFQAQPVFLPGDAEKISFNVRALNNDVKTPVELNIAGTAEIDGRDITRRAVPSEDWMQAFLWRHLVPTQQLLAYRYSPPDTPPRPLPEKPDISAVYGKKMPKGLQQVAGRVKQVANLYQDGLLTAELYTQTVTGLMDYEDGVVAK
jgi:hypothetical protein